METQLGNVLKTAFGTPILSMEYEEFLTRVGVNLKNARHAAGHTREEVASGPGGVRYLWELENAQRPRLSLQKLFELAQFYGVTVADLVSVPGARPSKKQLSSLKVEGPKRGRKPKGHPKARG